MPIFMNASGKEGEFKGEVQYDDFLNWIEVESYQFGACDHDQGTPDGRQDSISSTAVEQVMIAKVADPSSSDFLDYSLSGKTIPRLEVRLVKMVEGEFRRVRDFVFEQVKVANVGLNASSRQPNNQDMLALCFGKIEWTMYDLAGGVAARGSHTCRK